MVGRGFCKVEAELSVCQSLIPSRVDFLKKKNILKFVFSKSEALIFLNCLMLLI